MTARKCPLCERPAHMCALHGNTNPVDIAPSWMADVNLHAKGQSRDAQPPQPKPMSIGQLMSSAPITCDGQQFTQPAPGLNLAEGSVFSEAEGHRGEGSKARDARTEDEYNRLFRDRSLTLAESIQYVKTGQVESLWREARANIAKEDDNR